MQAAIARAQRAADVPAGRTEKAQAFNRARELAKIADLQRDLARINAEANQIVDRQVGAHARQGARRADQLARDAGLVRDDAPILGALTGAESARAAVISRSKQTDVTKAINSISSPNGVVGRAIRQSNALGLNQAKLRRVLAGGALDGSPAAALKAVRDLYRSIGDGKVVEVVNKHGVVMEFDADHYAGLVYRTAMAEATNTAEVERLVARQAYYVKIIGSNSIHFCTAYVGKVYYIGPGEDPLGYPRIDTLPRGGAPFHPNCSKRYVPFNPATATPAQIESAKPSDETRRLAGIDEAEAQQRFEVQRAKEAKQLTTVAGPPREEPAVAEKKTGMPTIDSAPENVANAQTPPAAAVSFPPEVERAAKDWAAGLTPGEADAVRRYQSVGEGYREINLEAQRLSLRALGPTPPYLEQTIADLDAAIAKGRLPAALPTFRLLRGESLLAEIERSAAAGILWPSGRFTSTSLALAALDEFKSKTGAMNIIFEWITPAGWSVAFPAASTGELTHQLELLFGRSTRFEILSIDKSGDPVRVKVRLG